MKLELKMDNKTFWFCVIIIFLIGLLVLGWNYTPIVIERYNCSCPEEKGLKPHFFENSEDFKLIFNETDDSFNIPNFEEDCEEVTCACYEEFGCMAKCYKC